MALDLPSVLGGLAQGFLDFGKSTVDLLGTGTASVADLVQSGGKSTKNQDDFRKWLYKTGSVEDASAKGLGTALNGAQTIVDFIPPVSAITKTPLGNGLQGAVGGLADEFKEYGKDYDLARAGERAAISGGAAIASGGLSDALKGSANSLLSSGAIRGLASGGIAGGVTGGGYAAIDGGDILEGAKQGASMGALVGGATGLGQDFRPAKTYEIPLTEEEKALRVKTIDDQIAKRARNNYADNRQAQFELLQKTNPMRDDYHTGIRSPEEIYTLKNIVDSYNEDNNFTYPDFTLADAQKAIANGSIDVYGSKPIEPGAFASPSKMMATDYAGSGEIYTKNIPLEDFAFIESGDEGNYLPLSKNKTLDATLSASENAINDKYSDLIKKAKNYKSLDRFEKMNNPIKGSEIWGEKPTSVFQRDSRAVRINMFPNDATKGTGITKQYLLNMFKDAYDDGITDIVPSYGSYTKEGASFMDHLADQGWVKQNGNGGWKSYEIAPKIAEWKKTTPLADIYNEAHGLNKTLETTLAASEDAINSAKLSPEQEAFFKGSAIRDADGNLMPVYHSSPNKFTAFDDSRLGQNTMYDNTGYGHFVTTDQDFSRRFRDINNTGVEGNTMELYADVKNPITHPYGAHYKYSGDDLEKILVDYYNAIENPDAITALKEYATENGTNMYDEYMSLLMGGESPFENVPGERDALKRAGYDAVEFVEGLKKDLVDGSTDDTPISSYAVFSGNKLKDINNLSPTENPDIRYSKAAPDQSLEKTLANDDMAVNSPKLTPEQEAFFKDSVIRDENGNLIPLYHGSNSKFTVFDSSKGGQSNKTAKVGHWFTPSKEGAEKWAGKAWWGDNDPTVYETYLNIKKPMVYESVDNSAQIEKLTTQLRQVEDRLKSTYRGSQEYYDAYKEYNNIANEIDNLSYTDPYEQFRSHIYAMEGKTPSQANVGGVGMAMNDEDAAVQKYVDMLKGEGYDGIIIKGTGYDQNVMGGPNDQYIVFDSNQIKNVNNLNPTSDPDIRYSKVAEGQLGLFDDMPTQTPKTPLISGPVDMSVEDLTKIAIDESTLPKGWKKAQELANMGKRAKQIVLDPNDPNRARNEYNVALYSDAQYGRNMPVADIIDKLGQIQYGREIDRGAARLLADQLDESGDEFAKKFVTGAAEAGGNISHYRDAPKAKLADEQLSNLLNIGRSNSMLSDSLANPSSRNARGDQWKGTINLDGKSIAKGSDGGISTFGHERLHAFQDAGNMGYDQRVVDAYNELHDDLSKIYHSDSQIRKDYGSDVKYWSKPIEQEARMAQFYLEDKFGVKGAQRVPERDANGKAIRYKDDGTIADPNNLLDYYTGKPAYKGEFEGDRKAINAAFDKFRGKLQDLTRKGVALPAFLTLLGGGAYMANQGQEKDKDKEEVL